jgi:Domain of unknown function (DUF4252)
MTPLRTFALALAVTCGAVPAVAQSQKPTTAGTSSGYVDGAMFRALIDEDQAILEVNLEGAILRALSRGKGEDDDDDESKELFSKLKSIHAIIGTVKGPASNAMAVVQQTDRKLAGSGWQRIAKIKDESSTMSVLTHTVGDRVDGLVVLIFNREDKELVFANLAGEIDITRLGEIGERFNVPGLDAVPLGN